MIVLFIFLLVNIYGSSLNMDNSIVKSTTQSEEGIEQDKQPHYSSHRCMWPACNVAKNKKVVVVKKGQGKSIAIINSPELMDVIATNDVKNSIVTVSYINYEGGNKYAALTHYDVQDNKHQVKLTKIFERSRRIFPNKSITAIRFKICLPATKEFTPLYKQEEKNLIRVLEKSFKDIATHVVSPVPHIKKESLYLNQWREVYDDVYPKPHPTCNDFQVILTPPQTIFLTAVGRGHVTMTLY